MEKIDRKYIIKATSISSGKIHTEKDSILFLLKDKLLPDLLDKYLELCSVTKVDERQMRGIQLLKDRVLTWQRANPNKVKLPDVAIGKEEKLVCRDNR